MWSYLVASSDLPLGLRAMVAKASDFLSSLFTELLSFSSPSSTSSFPSSDFPEEGVGSILISGEETTAAAEDGGVFGGFEPNRYVCAYVGRGFLFSLCCLLLLACRERRVVSMPTGAVGSRKQAFHALDTSGLPEAYSEVFEGTGVGSDDVMNRCPVPPAADRTDVVTAACPWDRVLPGRSKTEGLARHILIGASARTMKALISSPKNERVSNAECQTHACVHSREL